MADEKVSDYIKHCVKFQYVKPHRKLQVNDLTHLSYSEPLHGQNDSKV